MGAAYVAVEASGLRWVSAAKQGVAEAFASATRLKLDLLVAAAFAAPFYHSCLRPSPHSRDLVLKSFTSIIPKGYLHTNLRVQIEG